MTKDQNILQIKALSKKFGGVQALSDVSISVRKGEIASFIGPNGAGKTTLFNMICRLYPPTAGDIEFEGQSLLKYRPHHLAGLGIGRTFQNLALFKHGTVMENLLVGMHAHLTSGPIAGALRFGKTAAEERRARQEAERIVEFLEIEEIRNVPVSMLPYGLQKRVEMGRALATRPRLLLLDEMVSGMNQEETEDIARFVLDLRDELNLTIIMIEHDMNVVMDISDSVHVLNFGVPIASGSPAQVAADPAVIDAYLGKGAA